MPSVIARETFPYAGITRKAGASFEASVEDTRILTLLGKVIRQAADTTSPNANGPDGPEGVDGDDSEDRAADSAATADTMPRLRHKRVPRARRLTDDTPVE